MILINLELLLFYFEIITAWESFESWANRLLKLFDRMIVFYSNKKEISWKWNNKRNDISELTFPEHEIDQSYAIYFYLDL